MTNQTVTQRYFDDISVGDSFEETKTTTTPQVVAFVNANGLPNGGGRFTDPVAAKALGLAKPIVPGPMSASMLTRVVTDWMGPLGRILSIDVSFRRPVQHDDVLRYVALVTDVNGDGDFAGTGSGAVHLDVTLANDRGETPVQGTAVVELPRRS